MTDAQKRLKEAYAANNIPWDPALEHLSCSIANRVAAHWEARASVDAWEPPTIRECQGFLDSVQPVPPNGSQSGRRRQATDIKYHGSGGAIRD